MWQWHRIIPTGTRVSSLVNRLNATPHTCRSVSDFLVDIENAQLLRYYPWLNTITPPAHTYTRSTEHAAGESRDSASPYSYRISPFFLFLYVILMCVALNIFFYIVSYICCRCNASHQTETFSYGIYVCTI